ncbi:MAG: hypothetical protein P8N76_13755 [Pirellulaceae bacterium]|nr:hypothetical protein [Pirellulaceae bacterium]
MAGDYSVCRFQSAAVVTSDGTGYAEDVPIAISIRISWGRSENQRFGTQVMGALMRQNFPGPTWFVQMDTNRNQKVSPQEFLGQAKLFQKLDRNGDGFIEASEAQLLD